MSILGLGRLRMIEPRGCIGSPAITSITENYHQMNGCEEGASSGWEIEWEVNLSDVLTSEQEIYVEHATNEAGDNWAFKGRYTDVGTIVYVIDFNPLVGDDGEGESTTVYHRIRAWIVPIDDGLEHSCFGPITGDQQEATENACAA